MRFFDIPVLLLLALQLTTTIGSVIEARASPKCDKKCAKSLIQRDVRSKSYCSSYLRAHGASAHTVTVTTKAKTNCVTVVRTFVTTSLDIFSEALVTTTLPDITATEYSSTVVIVTGPTRVIGRRAVEETEIAPRAPPLPPPPPPPPPICTCRNLSLCSSNTISAACLEIAPPRPITKTITKPCTTTTTTTSTTRKFTEITSGTLTVAPGAAATTTTINQIHTTLVPEECTRDFYTPPSDIGSAGVFFLEYPNFATNPLECCTACFGRKNCAASAYSSDLGSCSFLIVMEKQPGGTSGACPLGRQDFSFIRDFDFGVNTLPGPCGV
ncbi:hypothetical protein EYR41_001487 [Orbilia oligospora]|uniref:Apple domain-containing protein n=1 Tax=Orbilia oligospora TaxID=2813651 RepID=A0A8H2EBE9_ORBOL|nr:hypothetical protein EYR41_001487 [Orbilia oligospora]